jgi:NADPH:quinone reductase-like Zn-dependent oxidoreductase
MNSAAESGTGVEATMRAMVQDRYGSPEVLQSREVSRPEPGEDQILVKVRAASLNPYDWHMMTGTPLLVRLVNGIRRPTAPVGADGAGIVEEVGAGVTEFAPGDEVWGSMSGAFAEYAVSREARLVPKPPNVGFEKAAALPIAAVTALQGLRDHGKLQSGQRVLVNGASGGVGTFAVMIAKAMGAHVTGVCSTRNIEMVRAIGADEVIDYTTTDYTKTGARYDVIFDTVTTKGIRANRRVMVEGGTWVQAGMKNKHLAVLLLMKLKMKLANIGSKKRSVGFLAKSSKDDLELLNGYLESGAIDPVIDSTFPLADAAAAMAHLGEGHARGKVILTM